MSTEDSAEPVLLRRDEDGIAWLTLNRPQARNALSVALMTALEDAIEAIGRDPSVKVVVIAGAGPGFCAGHDLREMRANPGRQHYEALFAQCARLMTSIVKLPKPVIARVHGIAAAAGCQLVATCDLAVAASRCALRRQRHQCRAVLLDADGGAVARGRAQGGARNAADRRHRSMPQRAQAIGLVNRVVPAEGLDDAVRALARQIAAETRSRRRHRQGGVLPPGRDWASTPPMPIPAR